MKTEKNRLERDLKMKNTANHQSAWSIASGALFAVANAGALLSVIILTVSTLTATPAFGQENVTNIKVELREVEKELGRAAVEIQEALDQAGIKTGIKIQIDEESSSRPKLGVYLSDMDFEDAYKMRYPFAFGVLVDGTVSNGNADNAGIIEDDVIMYFDGSKVLYEDHLVRLIRSQHFGDQVNVVYWRDEARDSTLVTFAMPAKKDDAKKLAIVEEGKDKKRRNSRGYGGGGFTPMLVQDEFADIDELMKELGLTNSPFRSEGIVLWGGSGQGYVGNGWFLGGFGNGGGLSNTVSIPDGAKTIERKIDFAMGFGGLTIEKRLAPFSFATIGAGVGLGGGAISLGVTQKDGQFSWDSLGTELLNTKTTSVNFSKNYAIIHPRVNVMLRLTSWMRLKAEYGYLYGYSFTDGWNTTLGDVGVDVKKDTYELVGSPTTELNAPSISLGLWFGF